MIKSNEIRYVAQATPLDDFYIELIFDNNERKQFDMRKIHHWDRLKEWMSQEYFHKLYLDKELKTVVWPNGYDLCPDMLYELSVKKPL